MTSIFAKKLRWIFAPTYDELTLFALSFTCILFFAGEFRSFLGSDSFAPVSNGAGPVVLVLMLATGICLSLYHSFSKRKKGRYEKQVMFLFAAFMNGFSGIWGGTYILSRSETWDWILIFPIINIITAYLILSQTRDRVLEEDCIDDKNVGLREVALSASIIGIAFLITRHYQHMHWAATLSICVAYGTNLNRVIVNFLLPEEQKILVK